MAFADLVRIEEISRSPERVELALPITPDLFQPHGLLHGGVTIALLETAASYGAEERCDFSVEQPFGLETTIRHRKPGRAGMLHGVAELEREEPASFGGRKQFWRVVATDDEGDVVSEGTFITKIVTHVHLAEKERQRAERRAAQEHA